MGRYAICGGHTILTNGLSTSATGIHDELVQDRIIKDFVIEYLKIDGNEVFDCTTPFDTVNTKGEDLVYKVAEVNKVCADLAVDIHLNSYTNDANGTETFVYALGDSSTEIANRINSNIVSLGFRDRKVQENSSLAFLKNTTCKSVLIECYFVSSAKDCELADTVGLKEIAKKISEGIVGHEINKVESEVDNMMLPDNWNGQKYLELNEDVRNSGMNPEEHWLNYGYRELFRFWYDIPQTTITKDTVLNYIQNNLR